MPWQSPYRGEASPADRLSPRAREWVSRCVMFGIGFVLAYFAVRGMVRISAADFVPAAATQSYNPYSYRRRNDPRLLLWVVLILMAFVGVTMAVAALLPVGTMQRLFETFNRPPQTGDRNLDSDDPYGRPWWLGGRWRWW